MVYDRDMKLADPAVFDHKHTGGRSRQFWDSVADGKTYTVTQGLDFTVELNKYRSSIYQAANRRGQRVQTVIDRDAGTITFRFTVPEQGETTP